MSIDESRSGVRASGALLLGALAATALAAVLGRRLGDLLSSHAGPWRVDAAVEVGVTAVGGLVALWLAASAVVAAVCVVVRVAGASWRAGERLVQRFAPGVVRKALVVVVGASVGLGMASGASAAAPTPSPSVSASSVAVVGADDLGWAVTTPADDAPPAPTAPAPGPPPAVAGPPDPPALASVPAAGAPAPAAPAAPADTVVVATGDSLWAIAARHLPEGATDAQIAEAWPQWYRTNSATIGADPGHIRPGQVLAVPATVAGASA
jgi:LysM repeat protein